MGAGATVPALWGALYAAPSGDVFALTGFGVGVWSLRGAVPKAGVENWAKQVAAGGQ